MKADSSADASWRSTLFSVRQKELPRLLLLSLFKALASFVFVILLSLKKSFLVTAPGGGAEVIPALKGTGVTTISVLFVLFYTWLLGRYTPRQIAYGIISSFVVFFLVYIFYLYPNAERLSPKEHAEDLLARYPQHRHWIAIYRYWMHAIFFIVAELWAQIIIVLIFWTIVNDLYSQKQARRLYHLMIVGGYMGGLCGTVCQLYWLRTYGTYGAAVQVMLRTMTGFAVVLLGFYTFLNRYYLVKDEGVKQDVVVKGPKKTGSISFLQSLRHVLSHPMLLAIAAMVVASNVTTNLVDTTFEANVKALYPDKKDYLVFTIRLLQVSIVVSILLGLFVSGSMMQWWGWRGSAYVQPVAVLVIGTLFLLSSKYKGSYMWMEGAFDCSALHIAVGIGAFQHIIWKVAKYIFFDSVREMAYLYVDRVAKHRGKAAIDLVGSRISKGMGGMIHTLVLFIAGTSSVLDVTSVILVIFLLSCGPWLYAVHFLAGHIEESTRLSSGGGGDAERAGESGGCNKGGCTFPPQPERERPTAETTPKKDTKV